MEQEETYVGIDVAKAQWTLPSVQQTIDGGSPMTRQGSGSWSSG